MVTIITERGAQEVQAESDVDALWMAPADVERLLGWTLKPEGLCRGPVCVPLSGADAKRYVRADAIDIAGLWRRMGKPVRCTARCRRLAIRRRRERAHRGAGIARGAGFHAARSFRRAAFARRLPRSQGAARDLGLLVRLPQRSARVADPLRRPEGSRIHGSFDRDGRRADAARPWIEAARPDYPVLIDRTHLVAELYNMVNVPQAVWIDEDGRIVRPTENAGAFEGFRAMDLATRKMPGRGCGESGEGQDDLRAAVRDWVEKGAASEHVFDPATGARPRSDDARRGRRRPR